MLVQILDLVDYVEESPPLSPFDKFLRLVYRFVPFRINHDERRIVRSVLEKFVLSLSDQQLVTGIAILSAGWIRHSQEKLYHFAMILDLAWMSSNTHLLTLTVLHDYFVQHHDIRHWRFALMACNFVMLFVGNVYSGISSWYDDFAYPAQCDFDVVDQAPSTIGGVPARYSKSSAVLLMYGYAGAIVGLFPGIWRPVTAYYRGHVQRHLDHYFDSGIRYHSTLLQLQQTPSVKLRRLLLGLILGLYEVAYSVLNMIFHIATSTAWNVFVFETFWFAYGNWGIWGDRAYAKTYMEGDEDQWGFGQLVPLFLLGLPLLSIVDNYYGGCHMLLGTSAADGRLKQRHDETF